jgi:hypothetical protein
MYKIFFYRLFAETGTEECLFLVATCYYRSGKVDQAFHTLQVSISHQLHTFFLTARGLYIGKYPPPLGGGKYQPMSFGGKNMKSRREKEENVKEKERKGKEKGRRGEKDQRGRKTVKLMQNREQLRQKGHNSSRKTTCRERGKKYHFQKGGGGKYGFWTKI